MPRRPPLPAIPPLDYIFIVAEKSTPAARTAMIGQIEKDGYPVIYKVFDVQPTAETRERFPWLTTVAWRFDREKRNGMPDVETNERVIALQDPIQPLAIDFYLEPTWQDFQTVRGLFSKPS